MSLEQYALNKRLKFLAEKAYPIMRSAALFLKDFMAQDKKGYWVTAPSISPENHFFDKSGKEEAVSIATTMDMSIIWDLYTNVIKAADILNLDQELKDSLSVQKAQLFIIHL